MSDLRPGVVRPRALLTGAFGSVGEWLLQELLSQGFCVTCLDLKTAASNRKAQRLSTSLDFDIEWGDLRDAAALSEILSRSRPAVIVHAAAIIPPLTIKDPDLGHAVNVGGTRNLIQASEAVGSVTRFVLVSSYSVCGPCNPYRDPPAWTGETPTNPQDAYGHQKVEAENIVRSGTLPWAIVRLCAVFPLSESGVDPDTLRFSFELPYDRREQAIDVRDAALAIARAAVVDGAVGKVLTIGGGMGWHGLGGDLTNEMVKASGLRPFPRQAYRMADRDTDESWFYENWVDTTESQRVLEYQRYSFADFLEERRRRAGFSRHVLSLFSGLITRRVLKGSPYMGKRPEPDRRPFAEAAGRALAASK